MTTRYDFQFSTPMSHFSAMFLKLPVYKKLQVLENKGIHFSGTREAMFKCLKMRGARAIMENMGTERFISGEHKNGYHPGTSLVCSGSNPGVESIGSRSSIYICILYIVWLYADVYIEDLT